MCFIIHPKHPTAKIAKKDIICYKLLDPHMHPRHYFSYPPYVLGKLNPSIRLETTRWCPNMIELGYHSFSIQRMAKRICKAFPMENPLLVKCIIPKGELYYYNPDDYEYVSTNIIIKEIIKT
jgi:hypothetical protein